MDFLLHHTSQACLPCDIALRKTNKNKIPIKLRVRDEHYKV